ncbi:heme O oxygenase [Kingella kingae ATCC 23330]|uniref:Heme O oxygenase n=1 Tax=Kingella kingae ATCC 23330 TaxID=887327 RepID=F5S6K7_KINKI|nr:heme O oxygenase [Kingella kingae ATCC 23330]
MFFFVHILYFWLIKIRVIITQNGLLRCECSHYIKQPAHGLNVQAAFL